MDARTGIIVGDIEEVLPKERKHYFKISHEQKLKMLPMSGGKRKNYMRNQPCPCESGRKFKKCCWHKYK